MMPTTLTLHLGVGASAVYPKRLHGAACVLLESPLADHGAADKPFSVGPVRGSEARPGTASWRLGWLTSQPAPPCPRRVAFGPAAWPVLGRDEATVSYAELCAGPAAHAADLDVVSPLYFSRNGRDMPMPDPVLVLTSLLRRWNHHAPAALRVEQELRDRLLAAVFLDAFDGRTMRTAVTYTQQQSGFVGTIRLALLRTAGHDVETAFAALMRFAVLAGIGAQTTHGFGAVNLMRLTARGSSTGRGSTQPVHPHTGTPENPSVLADPKTQVNPHDHDQ
ncbi:MAG: CRISPR system precrRNA processing endoribonuclease RAMP protein Cas6 [Sciscionella sp.]